MNELGRWPSATDYIDAVQHPGLVFAHERMKEARFDLDMYGIPDGCTGSNAIVFRAMLGPKTAALRCFISQAGLSRERYLALARHVHDAGRGARWIVPATWWDEAVRVRGQQWPVVEMEWVDGRPLDIYVGSLSQSQPESLHLLAANWRAMLHELAMEDVAHGDLQHGNVLIDHATAGMRLVDLDSAWVPGMDGLAPPAESGHQAFQHPNRVSDGQWGAHMDTFAGLVVMVSLVALAHRPGLWSDYNNGDNLLFTADDFVAVDATPLWSELGKINDREFAELLLCLKNCCDAAWQPSGSFEKLIAGESRVRAHKPVLVEREPDPPSAPDQPTSPPPERATASPSAEPIAIDVQSLLDHAFDSEVTVGDTAALGQQVGPESTHPVGSPAATTVLPLPPTVESPKMHAPVENMVLTAQPRERVDSANPFHRPPMARGRGAAPDPSAARSMASGYMGWAVVAMVVSLFVGFPAYIIARRARAASRAGDVTRAVELSHRAKRLSVTIVAIMVIAVIVVAIVVVSAAQ